MGVLLAGVFGPWLLREAFGEEYRADGALLAWLTAAAIAIALLTLTGAATVAAALHRAYSAGWGQRDGGVDAVAAAAARPGDPHGDRAAVRADGGNRRAPGRACQGIATVERVFWCGIDMRYQDVWIVVPAFNEASVIGDVIADVRSVFDHVVCVDDGSTRRHGRRRAARGGARRVASGQPRPGRGDSDRRRVRPQQPGAAVFATFDADGQHRVKDVVAMIDRLSAEDVDMVVGTRFAEPGVVAAAAVEADHAARGGRVEPDAAASWG